MHILMIPSAYPTEDAPIRSAFFKEQAIAINDCANVNLAVVYNETRRVNKSLLKNINKFHFQKTITKENGVNTLRLKGFNLLTMRNSIGINMWVNQNINLFKKYIKKFGTPDLIHIQCGLYGGMVGKKIKEMYNIPYIITEHASVVLNNRLSQYQNNYLTEVYNNADLLISVSERLKESINKLTDTKVVVINNLIDDSIFSYKGSKKEVFTFITVCNLKKDKNVDAVIKSFAKVFKENYLVELIIIGDGPEKNNLENLIQELGVSNKIKLLGLKLREEIQKYYQLSSAFVLASKYETFGVVYIEALASGLPIIATKCGGPEEFFEEDFGYLINKEDEDELELAMKNIYNNIQKFDNEKISLKILEKFKKEVIANKIIEEYMNVLER